MALCRNLIYSVRLRKINTIWASGFLYFSNYFLYFRSKNNFTSSFQIPCVQAHSLLRHSSNFLRAPQIIVTRKNKNTKTPIPHSISVVISYLFQRLWPESFFPWDLNPSWINDETKKEIWKTLKTKTNYYWFNCLDFTVWPAAREEERTGLTTNIAFFIIFSTVLSRPVSCPDLGLAVRLRKSQSVDCAPR